MLPYIKRQHHVWRHYLEAWANDGQIYCKQPDKIFVSNLTKIAVEKNFYKLNELRDTDIKHLKYFMTKIKPEFLELDNYIIMVVLSIINSKEKNKSNKDVDVLMNVFEENLNSEIEKNSIKYLDYLRNSDISFFENEKEHFEFIIFISTQHFRTKKFKEIYTKSFNSPIHGNSVNLVNVIRLIFTFNFAGNLIEKNYKIQLLTNKNEYSFITGDQPVINLVGDGKNQPQETVLYYPITPKTAIKLFRSDEIIQSEISIDKEVLKFLNSKISENSYFQTYSNDEKSFECV